MERNPYIQDWPEQRYPDNGDKRKGGSLIKRFKNKKRIKAAIDNLPDDLKKKHAEALAEGHKDEVCSKCDAVFLAHQHLVMCYHAPHGDCPMSGGTSVLDMVLGGSSGRDSDVGS